MTRTRWTRTWTERDFAMSYPEDWEPIRIAGTDFEPLTDWEASTGRETMSADDWNCGYAQGSETNDKRWFCLQLAAQLCPPAETEKIIEVAEKFAAFVTNHSPAAAAQSD